MAPAGDEGAVVTGGETGTWSGSRRGWGEDVSRGRPNGEGGPGCRPEVALGRRSGDGRPDVGGEGASARAGAGRARALDAALPGAGAAGGRARRRAGGVARGPRGR